jgi:hypothetical protein
MIDLHILSVELIKFDRDISDKKPEIKQELQAAQLVD